MAGKEGGASRQIGQVAAAALAENDVLADDEGGCCVLETAESKLRARRRTDTIAHVNVRSPPPATSGKPSLMASSKARLAGMATMLSPSC